MAKIAFAILGFSMMLNMATGLLFTLIPGFENGILENQYISSDNYTTTFTDPLEKQIKPSGGAVEDKGSAIWRILDMINVGFISKFVMSVNSYLFGFINLLAITFAPILSKEMFGMLFVTPGYLYICMTIVYLAAAFGMWTGRDISGRT